MRGKLGFSGLRTQVCNEQVFSCWQECSTERGWLGSAVWNVKSSWRAKLHRSLCLQRISDWPIFTAYHTYKQQVFD